MKFKAIDISKSFDNRKILDNVSFELEEAMITGLVGRNGTGKTTLLKILSHIYKEDKGEILIGNESLKSNPGLIKNIGFLPATFNYFDQYKLRNIPDFYKAIYDNFNQDYFFKEINEIRVDPNQAMRTFSKGEKNIIGLVTMLASGADILFLDEILDGMDVINKGRIINYLLDAKENGKSILTSSHILEALSGICDNIFYLRNTGILEDISMENSKKLSKVQIVFKDKIPNEIKESFIILSQIGRVAQILINLEKEKVNLLLDRDDIIQYDFLDPKIEDYFYLEAGGKYVG